MLKEKIFFPIHLIVVSDHNILLCFKVEANRKVQISSFVYHSNINCKLIYFGFQSFKQNCKYHVLPLSQQDA